MNILMIHPHDLFSKSEPWTIRIESIAREFVKNTHNVKLCYFPLVMNRRHYPKIIDSIDTIPLSRTPSPKSFFLNLLKLIKLCKWADIVHLQKCHHYASIPAVLASYITGKPFHYDWDDWEEKIFYESCGRSLNSRFIGFSFKVLERLLPLLADSVSCASTYLKKLTHEFGVENEYIFDSPVGADINVFRPDLDGNWVKEKYGIEGELVLYVGQLHGAQYVDLFINAANHVLKTMPDLTFMIVGEGFLEDKLKRLTQNLKIENKVIFTGSVSHNEVPFYMAAASVGVASFKDTEVTRCKSPLKIVEYLASGKPIVSSDVGETRKMLDGAGLLVEPDSYHSLAEGIIRLLKDRNLRDNLSRSAREKAENIYNWPTTASSLLKVYGKII